MDISATEKIIKTILPELTAEQAWGGQQWTISANKIIEVLQELKINDSTQYNFLVCEMGFDLKNKLGAIYHLRSTVNNTECFLKVELEDRIHPTLDSATNLYPTAEFFEREIFDLYGINYNNHPNLKRLFLEDDFEGYPLRKDFSDPINIVER